MPIRLPEPGSFEALLHPVQVGVAAMLRLSRFPDSEPWWSRNGRYRFDDPGSGHCPRFGVLYLADDVQTAFAESVIHDNAVFDRGRFLVARAELEGRWKTTFLHPRKKRLRLADLSGHHLKALGLNNDISAGDDYAASQAWAKAIHDSDTKWDGIRYVSRQRNDGHAYAIFERSTLVRGATAKLEGAELDALCARFRIDALP